MNDEYDVMVVGAGHHGFVAAHAVAKGGLSVLLVDAVSAGGRTRTIGDWRPGFRHDPHATFLLYDSFGTATSTTHLSPVGLRTICPAEQQGIAFADGRPPVLVVADSGIPALRGGSRADTDAFADLSRRAGELIPAVSRAMTAAHDLRGLGDLAEATADQFADIAPASGWGSLTTEQLLADVFEGMDVQLLLARTCLELGGSLTEGGSALGFLSSVLPLIGRMRVPLGGMSSVAEALGLRAKKAGVAIHENEAVEAVQILDGLAVGVELGSSRVVGVRRGVVLCSAITVQPIPGGLVRGRAPVVSADATSGTVVASTALTLRGRPRYSSARWDPRLDDAAQVFIGCDDLDHLKRADADLRAGALPPPYPSIKHLSHLDPSRAPAGWSAASADSMFPHAIESWDYWPEIRDSFGRALISTWEEYAPGITAAVDSYVVHEPGDFARAIDLAARHGWYRTPVENVYRGDSTTFPGGGVHGVAGERAARALLADLGVLP